MPEQDSKPRRGGASARPTEEVQTRRPEVIVEVLFDRGVFYIAVNNIGDRAAYKISVNFNKKILGLGGDKDISALPLFRNIEFLGPQREIKTIIDTSHSYFQRKQPGKVSAQITYHDSEKRKYEVTINHDLEIYRDLPYLTSNPNCCD